MNEMSIISDNELEQLEQILSKEDEVKRVAFSVDIACVKDETLDMYCVFNGEVMFHLYEISNSVHVWDTEKHIFSVEDLQHANCELILHFF
jgi:hypothetical protein